VGPKIWKLGPWPRRRPLTGRFIFRIQLYLYQVWSGLLNSVKYHPYGYEHAHLWLIRLDALALSVIATATWLAGWLAGWLAVCHSRYCIKTTKPILKLFRPSDSPIIEAFGTPYADTKFQGELLHRRRLIQGVGKIGDFRRTSPFI